SSVAASWLKTLLRERQFGEPSGSHSKIARSHSRHTDLDRCARKRLTVASFTRMYWAKCPVVVETLLTAWQSARHVHRYWYRSSIPLYRSWSRAHRIPSTWIH